MQTDLDATTHTAVELLWDTFREHRRWPSTKEFLLRAIDSGLTVQAMQRCSAVSLRGGGGEEVRPSFEALISLPEVRELLAPLPAVLRHAASVFVDQALLVPDHFLPTIHFREVKSHWKDSSSAMMAFEVLRNTSSGFFLGSSSSATNPEDISFSISIDYLRYEHVDHLDEVLRIREQRRAVDPGRFPSGQHLELLQRIHETSGREQRWPRALSFAIAMREVGYVPQLATELRNRFVRGEFQPTQHHSIVLTLEALPFVDPSGDDRALFARAVRGIVDIWRACPGTVEIPVAELATSLNVTPERLGPVVAFLESSRWCSTGHPIDDSHANLVLRPGDPVLVLRNASVSTFDEYMNAWDEERDDTVLPFSFGATAELGESKDQDAPPVPELPFDFVKKDTYRRVLESDLEELRRAVAAGAWKASLILIGGIIEGALLDVLSRREDISESQLQKRMSKASLMDLITAGVELGLVPAPVLPFAEGAKDYRDLVHPFRSGASPLRAAVESVRAMLHAVDLIVKELDAAARDGRLSRFELT